MNTNELITKLHSEVIEKQQKINELQKRIDETIEYIGEPASDFTYEDIKKILKILKGEE